jgi:hypothetical protein
MLYLGKYKSKASREKYDEIIGKYLANGKRLPPTRQNNEIIIQELAVRFLEWAGNYYGDKTPTFGHCRLAITLLVQHYGKHTVSDFGPLSLVFLQDKWVESGKARKSINRYTAIIRQAVKWGVSRELVPADV